MKVGDRFSGHLADDDPRHLLLGAGGCTWPTLPAWRYTLESGDATGHWAFLNEKHPLIQQQPGGTHGIVLYHQNPPLVPEVLSLWAVKGYEEQESFYVWYIDFWIDHNQARLQFYVVRPYEKCNRDLVLGDRSDPGRAWGSTGTTFRMRQVEFDETEPP